MPKTKKKAQRGQPPRDPYNPDSYPGQVWVHPDLNRLLKGADHKFMTDEAHQYWLHRQRQKAGE